MKNPYIYLSLLALLLNNSQAQIQQDWVQRYNGPGNGNDVAYSIIVDASGNIYITGYSIGNGNEDYATIKYDSSGVQQWVARYNGPGNAQDEAHSIVVDASGNVYVTGGSTGNGTSLDFATIKYNSSGVQQWVQRYNGPANSNDAASSIAVDGLSNVYVTGYSIGNGTYQDYTTIKYNSSGVQQWVQRYDGPGNYWDYASSIVSDNSGNVYVTGGSSDSAFCDYATIKYNSSGVQQWVQRYNGPGNEYDYANSIALDISGNVYVTGWSDSSTTSDYATIKYNSSGIQQWVARYTGQGDGDDYANSIVLDGSANVYVTGRSRGSVTYYDYATIKYNSSGVQQWAQRYNGPANGFDDAYSIALDQSGNVYVTGWSPGNGTSDDYATIKYNSTGVLQWVQRYNGLGNGNDDAYSIAVDNAGNVYVTGYSYGNVTANDYSTIKYIPSLLPIAPVLFSPPNNSQGWGLAVNLVWYRVTIAVSYHVQLSTDSSFNTFILNDSTVTDSIRTVSGLQNNTYYFWRVAAKNVAGTGPWSVVWKFRTGFVGIQPVANEIPKEFKLYNNYPNPFNPTTKIRFALPKSSFAKLVVYDILGRQVAKLVNEQLKPGTYEIDFDGSNYPSGVYYYKLVATEYVETKKMVLIK